MKKLLLILLIIPMLLMTSCSDNAGGYVTNEAPSEQSGSGPMPFFKIFDGCGW